MNLGILPESKELLDIAFRRARKEAAMLKSQRNSIKDAKGKNIRRIEVSANYVIGALERAVSEFPSIGKANPFYKELIESTIDVGAVLKALGHMTAEKRIIKKLRGRHIGDIKGLAKGDIRDAHKITTGFYGRLSSLVKKLDKSIEEYNKAVKKLRELPQVKTDMPTVILAGCPNTGKTTIIGRITKSKPKIAAYPFTTKKLQIGYLIHNYSRIQVIDTPGLLDRRLEKRNALEKKGIAALRHLANAIVFVVDPTMMCGFPLEKQFGLLEEIKKEFGEKPVLIVLNKADIAGPAEMEKAKKLFGKAVVEGEGTESGLRAEIGKIVEGLPKEKGYK